MKFKVYLCMAYRGIKGDDATQEDVQINIQKARAIQLDIRKHWPETVALYVPHTCKDLQQYNELWFQGAISNDEIMAKCIEKLSAQDAILVIKNGHVSSGMQMEIDYADLTGMAKFICDEWDLEAMEEFAYFVHECINTDETVQ